MSARTRVEDRITNVGGVTFGQVRAFQTPSKGPRRVTLESQGQRSSLDAQLAEGCVEGDQAIVELRDGALGQPWVSRLRCSRAP